MFTGLASVPGIDQVGPVTSIDHAVWFHRQARMSEWIWQDLRPQTVAGGRGWYTGAFYTQDGTRVASVAQETLFRKAATE